MMASELMAKMVPVTFTILTLLFFGLIATRGKPGRDCLRYPHWDPFTGFDFRKAESKANTAGCKNSWHCENFRKYGNTYQVVSWGQRVFHTMDTVNSQSVLSTQATLFGVSPSRGSTAGPWLGKGVSTTDGDDWHRSRELLKPIFNKAQVSNLTRLEQYVLRLVRCITINDGTVDLQGLFTKMYLDYTTDFIFGQSTDSLILASSEIKAAKLVESFDRSLRQVAYAQSTPWIFRVVAGAQKRWNEPFKLSHSYVDGFIESSLENHRIGAKRSFRAENANFVFLDELVQESGNHDKIFLRGQILNIFLPAREASASGIGLVFFQLARHPDVWTKVRQEVIENQELLTYDVVRSLDYTGAVVTEALRLLSPAPYPVRTALVDWRLPRGGGKNGDESISVTKGSKIVLHAHAVHRDESIWGADAHEYRPERWLTGDGNLKQRKAWEYLPFSGGSRICPAAQMIHTQFVYIVAILAREFVEIHTTDPKWDVEEDHRISMKSRHGVKVRLIKPR